MDSLPLRPGFEVFEPIQTHEAYYHEGPGVIVRDVSYDTFGQDPLVFAKSARIAYTTLQNCGVDVVPCNFVVAEEPTNLLLLEHFIEGTTYDDEQFEFMPAQHQAMVRALLNNLAVYLHSSIEHNIERLGDIYGLHQYVFTDTQCVLVDMGIFIHKPKENDLYAMQVDFMDIRHLADCAATVFAKDPEEKSIFLDKLKPIIKTAAAKNRTTIVDEEIDEFLVKSCGNSEFNTDAFVTDILTRRTS